MTTRREHVKLEVDMERRTLADEAALGREALEILRELVEQRRYRSLVDGYSIPVDGYSIPFEIVKRAEALLDVFNICPRK